MSLILRLSGRGDLELDIMAIFLNIYELVVY